MDRHEGRTAVTGGDDPLELRTWNRLRTCTGRIATLLAQRLRSEYGMNPARLDLLGHLHQAPEGLAMTALARRLMVTNASVTGLVDRMETEGLVERRPSPVDRRRTLIAATRTGTAIHAEVASAYTEWLRGIFAGLPRNDLVRLYASLELISEAGATESGRHQPGSVQ